MAKKNKALGRGLSALIPTQKVATSLSASPATNNLDEPGLQMLGLEDIIRSESQPRRRFDQDALDELAASIKGTGLIQPIVVRKKNDKFEIIAGERRWRASKIAGLSKVPVVIRDLSDKDAFAIALVENIQREDLNALEEASGYRRLIDEYGFTQNELAETVGKSRSGIANTLRLLQLSETIQQYVIDGELSAGHARSLIGFPEGEAEELAELIVKHGYTVREAEELAKESKDNEKSTSPKKSVFRDDVQVRNIAEELQRVLGTKVVLKDKKGKGRIEIQYANYDVLQDVLDRILGENMELG